MASGELSAKANGLAIKAEGLGVHYNLRFTRRNTLRRTLFRWLQSDRSESGGFWAIRDVSLEVRKGEIFGIVGANGAGKSTLLLVLAGILKPDTGYVRVNGRVSTLLTLGAGFDAELSGRDNIYLNGAFLGLTKGGINDRSDKIIEFSELGEFIDIPLKRYSSGMRARLGFAIATSIDPDILLLDEVLGVGDAAFKEKSKEKLHELVQKAQAIVLVAHDLSYVQEMCGRAVWIQDGRVAAVGDSAEVTEAYTEWVRSTKGQAARPLRLTKP